MVNTALVAAVALACSGSVMETSHMQLELAGHSLAIPAVNVRCDVPQHVDSQALLARLEQATDAAQPLQFASPYLTVGDTVLSCEALFDPCEAYETDAFELQANNSTKKKSESKADKEPLYCGGEQFELIDDDDDPDVRAFSYFKISIVELFMTFVGVLMKGGMVISKTPSTVETAGRLITSFGHCYYVVRVALKYLILMFTGKIDYFCHTLGMFSYRAVWMASNFAVNAVVLFFVADKAENKVLAYAHAAGLFVSVLAGAVWLFAWLLGSPVILFLLFVNVATLLLFLPWFIGFMVINLFPFHIGSVGFAVLVAKLGRGELKAEASGMATVGMVRAALLILMIPIFLWYNFGYFTVTDGYNKTPSFLLRLIGLNSKILADLKFDFGTLEDFIDPSVVSLGLLRFATDYVGILTFIRGDSFYKFLCNLCKSGKGVSGGTGASTGGGAGGDATTTSPTSGGQDVELA